MVGESVGSNAFISPYGAKSALLAATLGARGRTRAEMLDQQDLLGARFDQVLEAKAAQLRAWEGHVTSDPDDFVLRSGIFVNNAGNSGFQLNPTYADAVEKSLGFKPIAFNFGDPAAVAEHSAIKNRWGDVYVHVPVNPSERVVLHNYLKLNGAWEHPMRGSAPRPFLVENKGANGRTENETVQMDMLEVTAPLRYLNDRDYRAVTLPLQRSRIAVDIIAPRPGVSLDTLVAKLDGVQYRGLAQRLDNDSYAKPTVRLVIPPVKKLALNGVDLRALYRKQGLVAPFADSADFGDMSNDRLGVSRFKQDIEWTFDSNGTAIWALTVMGMVSLSAGGHEEKVSAIDMIVDRSYLVVYREKVTGEILFLLRVVDPRSGKDS